VLIPRFLNSELTDEREREREREREGERGRERERRREKKKTIWEVCAAIDPTLPFVALTLARRGRLRGREVDAFDVA